MTQNKMKAVLFFQYGSPDVLTNGVAPVPALNDDEILVKVHAAGINPLDYKIRQGKLKLITGKHFPKIPGSDFSGIVIESKSAAFKKGDHVAGMTNPMVGGSYAEMVRVDSESIVKIPKTIQFEEAAGIPIAGLTALQSLRNKGNISPKNKVLIIGASGGVGTFAVQIAKIMGAEVTGICSNRNVKLVSSLGADHVIDYTSESWTDEMERYDIVLDTVNKFGFARIRKYLNPGSTYIMTSPGISDIFSTLNPMSLNYNFKSIAVKTEKEDLNQLVAWIKAEKLKVVIDKVFQFDDAVNAHIYGESGRARGKLILKI